MPLVVCLVLAAAVAALCLQQLRTVARDRQTAVALAEAMLAPRAVFDGLPLESRYDASIEEFAASQGRPAKEILDSLERFASGGILGTKRVGFDAFLAQLATRRFEIAIAGIRELAMTAKANARPELSAWRLLSAAAILEFGRGRAIAAEPLVQQAFELANRRDELDSANAAGLLTVYGAIHMSRSRAADAEPYFRRAVSILRKAPGGDLRDCARVLTHYGQSIAAQGFPEEAEVLYAEALGAAAQFRKATGRRDTSEPVLEQTYRKLLRDRGLADAEIARKIAAVMDID